MENSPPSIVPPSPASTSIEAETPPSTQKSSMFLPIILTFIITSTLLISGYFGFKQLSSPLPDSHITPTPTPFSSSQQISDHQQLPQFGTVTGKICYPSSFIPSGTIEAKNITTEKIFTKEYKGSDVESSSQYSLDLPPGTYHLRYVAGSNGYYSNCATHLDDCLSDESHRLIDVVVAPSTTQSLIDLCDYYYSPTTEPEL